MSDTEKAVPLIERLRRVPSDARLIVEKDYFSSSSYAVGPLAHEAAAEIARLQASMRKAVLAEREACALLCEETRFPDSYTATRCAAAIRARGET